MTDALIAALRAEADRLEAATCTGVAASWCPVHGDCRCPEPPDPHERRDLNHPHCPLHNPTSSHAEPGETEHA